MVVRRIAVLAAVVGVTFLSGGCVMKSTHDAVLAKLDSTQASLDETTAANVALEAKVQQANMENMRLRRGLEGLADQCSYATKRIMAVSDVVAKLKGDKAKLSELLAQLAQLAKSQAGSTDMLSDSLAPLMRDMEQLRGQASALAGPMTPLAPGPAVSSVP